MDDLYQLSGLSRNASADEIRRTIATLNKSLAHRVEHILLVPHRRRAYNQLLKDYNEQIEIRRKVLDTKDESNRRNASHATQTSSVSTGGASFPFAWLFGLTVVFILVMALGKMYMVERSESYPPSIPSDPSTYSDTVTTATGSSMESSVGNDSLEMNGDTESEACRYAICSYKQYDNMYEVEYEARSLFSEREENDISVLNRYRGSEDQPIPGTYRFRIGEYYTDLVTSYVDMQLLEQQYNVDLVVLCVRGNESMEVVYD